MKRVAYVLIFAILALSGYVHAQPDTLWTKTFGGRDDDWGYSVQQTTDCGYIIAGSTQSYGAGGWDIYLMALRCFVWVNLINC